MKIALFIPGVTHPKGHMNSITSYHLVAPGDLWVRTGNGTLRPASAKEEITLLSHAPDIGVQFGFHDHPGGAGGRGDKGALR